jgi:histone H3/H4
MPTPGAKKVKVKKTIKRKVSAAQKVYDGLGIKNSRLKQLARRAGTGRIRHSLLNDVREVLTKMVEAIMRPGLILLEHNKRKKFKIRDLEGALSTLGIYLGAAINRNAKTTKSLEGYHSHTRSRGKTHKEETTKKARPGTATLREMKHLQKHSDNLLIHKSKFDLLVREVSKKFKDDVSFERGCLDLLQLVCEKKLMLIYQKGKRLAEHAHRATVMSEDLKLAIWCSDDPLFTNVATLFAGTL